MEELTALSKQRDAEWRAEQEAAEKARKERLAPILAEYERIKALPSAERVRIFKEDAMSAPKTKAGQKGLLREVFDKYKARPGFTPAEEKALWEGVPGGIDSSGKPKTNLYQSYYLTIQSARDKALKAAAQAAATPEQKAAAKRISAFLKKAKTKKDKKKAAEEAEAKRVREMEAYQAELKKQKEGREYDEREQKYLEQFPEYHSPMRYFDSRAEYNAWRRKKEAEFEKYDKLPPEVKARQAEEKARKESEKFAKFLAELQPQYYGPEALAASAASASPSPKPMTALERLAALKAKQAREKAVKADSGVEEREVKEAPFEEMKAPLPKPPVLSAAYAPKKLTAEALLELRELTPAQLPEVKAIMETPAFKGLPLKDRVRVSALVRRTEVSGAGYKLKAEDNGYFVITKETGRKHSKKPLPKARAEAQMRALYANVKDAKRGAGLMSDFLSGLKEGAKPFQTLWETAKLVGKLYRTAGKQAVKRGGYMSYYQRIGQMSQEDKMKEPIMRYEKARMEGFQGSFDDFGKIDEGARRQTEAHNQRIAQIKQEAEDRERRRAEIEEKIRRDEPFRKIVSGLTKVADFAIPFLEKVPGVGNVAAQAYKAFAPPGSQYSQYPSPFERRGSGKTKREQFYKLYKVPRKAYSINELSRISKVPLAILKKVYKRGIGAAATQPTSVRLKGSFVKNVDAPKSKKLSPQQWAMSRVYSFLVGGDHDEDLRKNLEGAGFFDVFKKAQDFGKKVVNEVANPESVLRTRISDVSKGIRKDNYPPSSRRTIQQYGDYLVVGLTLRRDPIESFINLALNAITLGNWSQAKAKANYDRMFHLGVEVEVSKGNDTKKLIVEKNEVINVAPAKPRKRDTEFMPVPAPSPPVDLRTFLQRAQDQKQDYFLYDAFSNNCQDFIQHLLRANGVLTRANDQFIKQDTNALIKELPSYTSKVARAITDLGGIANVALEGGKTPHSKLKAQLEEIGLSPEAYLRTARSAARKAGYKNASKLTFSSKPTAKLTIPNEKGTPIHFGRAGYGDFLIWSHLEKKKKAPKGTAEKKRATFQKSHSAIKGDWRSDDYSPNNLALRVLW
jgi:hypothetical protein